MNSLSLHPSTLSFIYFSLEKINKILFGGINYNFHRAIDVAKISFSFLVFLLIKNISINGMVFVILSMLFNFVAGTSWIDEFIIRLKFLIKIKLYTIIKFDEEKRVQK